MKFISLSLLLLCGCGGSRAQPSAPQDLPVPPQGTGVQLKVPAFTVAPHTSRLMCTVFPALGRDGATDPIILSGVDVLQAKGGHHLIVFQLITQHAPGEFPCPGDPAGDGGDQADMITWRLVAGGVVGNTLQVPPGAGFRLDPRQQIMIQSHYENLGDTAVTSHDEVNLYFAEAPPAHFVDYWALNDSGFKVPPHQSASVTDVCNVDQDTNVVMLLGHEHQWGTGFHLSLLDANSDAVSDLYSQTDGALLVSDPPISNYSFDHPLALKAGQKLKMTCSWFNTTDQPLQFPEEMCAALMMYYPGNGFHTCDNGINDQ